MKTAHSSGLKRRLFLSFAKIGLFTFGGGFAMIAFIEAECVEKNQWITHDEMMNLTVIAESTPGPIAVNCATYVGYKQGGVIGAVIATLGMVLPSFVIIFLISKVFDDFLSVPLIANIFQGIKVAVGLLILNAAITMMRKMHKRIFACVVIGLSCTAMLLINVFSLRLSSIYLMLTAGIVSLALFAFKTKRQGNGGMKNDLP